MDDMEYYICAILKDEQLYLKEWIDWHLNLGFTKIFLYEDFTSSSHEEITKDYPQVELHSMKEVSSCVEGRVGRQIAVYNHFIKTHKKGWCLFIDIDEYLHFDEDVTLESLITDFKDEYGIEIQWKCYGANGHIKRPQMSIQEAYIEDYREHWNPHWKFKCFVNLEKSQGLEQNFVNCHYHKRVVNTEHQKGDFRQSRNKLSYKLCWINHYITKSWQDYCLRLQRGNITSGLRTREYFFKLNPNLRGKV